MTERISTVHETNRSLMPLLVGYVDGWFCHDDLTSHGGSYAELSAFLAGSFTRRRVLGQWGGPVSGDCVQRHEDPPRGGGLRSASGTRTSARGAATGRRD